MSNRTGSSKRDANTVRNLCRPLPPPSRWRRRASLAHEAADSGLLSPELAAGISRVKGFKQLGFRSGNWLSAKQSSEVLKHTSGDSMRAKRDYAMLALLFGCGFRRSELVRVGVGLGP